MFKIVISCFVLFLAVALILPSSYSVVPDLMNYQGMVRDSVGDPVDGTFSLTFRIYNASSGGTLLWSETHPSVSVSEGLFNVVLGSQGSGLTQSTFAGTAAWLEIQLESQIVGPRTRMTTLPYSHRVKTVDGADAGEVTGDLVVTGSVKAAGPIEPLGGIVTPGGITIQSAGSNVVVIAGSSIITVSPAGGVTIQGTDVAITAADELTLSASNKVAIDAPWVDLHSTDSLVIVSDNKINMVSGTSLTVQAGTSINTSASISTNIASGNTTTVNGSGQLDLNGGMVTIN